jgi:hypothetical protein
MAADFCGHLFCAHRGDNPIATRRFGARERDLLIGICDLSGPIGMPL